jgi:hypothetical protein
VRLAEDSSRSMTRERQKRGRRRSGGLPVERALELRRIEIGPDTDGAHGTPPTASPAPCAPSMSSTPSLRPVTRNATLVPKARRSSPACTFSSARQEHRKRFRTGSRVEILEGDGERSVTERLGAKHFARSGDDEAEAIAELSEPSRTRGEQSLALATSAEWVVGRSARPRYSSEAAAAMAIEARMPTCTRGGSSRGGLDPRGGRERAPVEVASRGATPDAPPGGGWIRRAAKAELETAQHRSPGT